MTIPVYILFEKMINQPLLYYYLVEELNLDIMKNLFRVVLTDYKSYFVITDSFDKAVDKVKEHLNLGSQVNRIVGYDGSLNTEPQEIKHVELLTDEILY